VSKLFLAALVLLAALPAAADVVRVLRPSVSRPVPRRAVRGEADAWATESGRPSVCSDVCVLDVEYFGGPVLSNVKVYAVFWSSAVSSGIASGMGDFYRTLTNSEWMDWLTEYSTTLDVDAGSHLGQPGTQQTIGRGIFAGSYTLKMLSKAYPACPDFPMLTCLQDADIQGELDWQIGQGNLPAPDANTLYMVHFPSTVEIQLGDYGSCQDFCAYHNAYLTTDADGFPQWRYYAVLPDLASNGCAEGCGLDSTFENTCSAASHELAESVTDSNVSGTAVDYPLAWYDNGPANAGEIADICVSEEGTLAQDGFTGCAAGDAGCYTVQRLFSRRLWDGDVADQPNVPACVVRRFDANDFSISLTPNSMSLHAGTSPVVSVFTSLTNGSPQPLTLSIASTSAGLHASLDSTSVRVGDVAHLTVSTDADAGVDGLVVVLASGATTHSAALLVQVDDWALSLSPSTGFVGQGTSQVYMLNGRVTSGEAEPVTLSPTVSGLPTGVTASFNTLTLTPGISTSLLTLSASPGTQPGAPTTFTVNAASPSRPRGHSVSAQLKEDGLPGVTIISPEAGATVSGVTTVQLAGTPGTDSALASYAVAVDGEPPSAESASPTLAWDTRGLSDGEHLLQGVARDADGVSNSASVKVTVANAFDSFRLLVSPSSVTVPPGGTATLTLLTAALGIPEPITVTFSGLPTGVDASFSSPVMAGDTAMVTLIAPLGTAPSSTTTSVLGTSPSRPRGYAVTATVSVQAEPASSGGCAASGGSPPGLGLWLLVATAFCCRRRTRSGLGPGRPEAVRADKPVGRGPSA
jgi:hypothetical protein